MKKKKNEKKDEEKDEKVEKNEEQKVNQNSQIFDTTKLLNEFEKMLNEKILVNLNQSLNQVNEDNKNLDKLIKDHKKIYVKYFNNLIGAVNSNISNNNQKSKDLSQINDDTNNDNNNNNNNNNYITQIFKKMS